MNLETVKNINLKEEDINLHDLQFLTRKTFNHDDVFDNNRKYSTTYKHIVDAYGFSDFYDLYLYCSNKGKLSKSVRNTEKVTKTIVRNEEEINVDIYGDRESVVNEENFNGGIDNEVNPRKLATIKTYLTKKGVAPDNIPNDKDMYLEIHDNDKNLIGLSYYTIGDNLTLDGFVSVPSSNGVGLKVVIKSILKSVTLDKGIEVHNLGSQDGIDFIDSLGFKKEVNHHQLSKDEVKNVFGDLADTIE